MIRQIFRESEVADICYICRTCIFTGDLAYRIGIETVCADCVVRGEFIAESELDGEFADADAEHLF